MKEETKLWFDKAEMDFKVAGFLLEKNENLYSIICFHCQQASEKYLKAFLVDNEIEFIRTHDLVLLLEKYIIPLEPEFEQFLLIGANLTEFAITTRYPGEIDDFDFTIAQKALNDTVLIRAFVQSRLSND